MEQNIQLSGLECDSCEKVVARLVEKNACTLVSLDAKKGALVVDAPSQQNLESLQSALSGAGYGVGGNPASRGDSGRFFWFLGKLFSNSPELAAERAIVEVAAVSLFAMVCLVALPYFVPQLSGAKPFAPLLFLGAAGTAACYLALEHFRSYTQPHNCMCGMMVGMTIGMIGGFLAGALSGAANGMFTGSVVGVVVGMWLGASAGSAVGVMGALEGLMAGLMSGTMGAMLSVMLYNDNLMPFLFILFAACVLILAALSYMLYRESGPLPEGKRSGIAAAVATNVALFAIFSAIIVWGPRSALAI
ncbi:MAG: hypothetical protein WC792_02705 [Candidatus Micrarchaeia archaeon]|jgi:hypothetical protein